MPYAYKSFCYDGAVAGEAIYSDMLTSYTDRSLTAWADVGNGVFQLSGLLADGITPWSQQYTTVACDHSGPLGSPSLVDTTTTAWLVVAALAAGWAFRAIQKAL